MAVRFTRLTRPAIRKLKAGERITEHGITAEGLPDGGVRYSINIMVDGQRIHRVIGRDSDGTTRSQCEGFIAKTRTEAKEGRLNLPKGRKTHLTFAKATKRLPRLQNCILSAKQRLAGRISSTKSATFGSIWFHISVPCT